MSKKQGTTTKATKSVSGVDAAQGLSPELIEAMRKAGSFDAALELVSPKKIKNAKANPKLRINSACTEPLPKPRGACPRVFTTCVLRQSEFTAQEIVDAMPDLKAAGYWTRQLVKSGHLVEVA